jgi:thymidylate synthase
MNMYLNHTVIGKSSEVWIKYCLLVSQNGSDFYDEEDSIIELRDVLISFKNLDPRDDVFQKFGDKKVIDMYSKKMQSTDIIPELNSSYGKRLFDQQGFNQINWVINRLKRKPETKAATISLLLPNDPGPRIPCLCILDFKIRDGELKLSGYFRSQNVLRSYANFISIKELQDKVAKQLGVKTGEMTFLVSSAHIYDKDMAEILKITKEYNGNN